MIEIDAGYYIANIRSDPRWMALAGHIENLIEERKEILSAKLIHGEADTAKANSLIGEIRAFKEIVLLPTRLAEEGQRVAPSGE